MVTKEWEDLFSQVAVSRLPREISNHNPLIVSTGKSNSMPFLQFRFDVGWIKNPDFIPLVEKILNKPCRAKSTIDKIQQKLKMFKQYFKGWGFNLQGEMRKKRKVFQKELAELEEIEEERGLNDRQVDKKVWLLCENLKSLEQKELYWYERSYENWLLQGDNNTAYFHRCANDRKRKKIKL